MKFFFRYELAKADSLSAVLLDEDSLTAGVDPGVFHD